MCIQHKSFQRKTQRFRRCRYLRGAQLPLAIARSFIVFCVEVIPHKMPMHSRCIDAWLTQILKTGCLSSRYSSPAEYDEQMFTDSTARVPVLLLKAVEAATFCCAHIQHQIERVWSALTAALTPALTAALEIVLEIF